MHTYRTRDQQHTLIVVTVLVLSVGTFPFTTHSHNYSAFSYPFTLHTDILHMHTMLFSSLFCVLTGSTPSTLVFEIQDGRHVLHKVATNVEQARQLRRQYPKSKKLHLYLSHTFVAVHVYRRQNCVVCKEKISGLIGKQAYQCRGWH